MRILLSTDVQNVLPLANQLEKFRDLQSQLVQAIEGDNEISVNEIDAHITQCWLTILDYMPRIGSERALLIEFFLDQIIANPGSGQLTIQSKERVLELAASCP